MPNRTYALEWIDLARKNLETAKLLFRENHYTEIIAIEIQQSIEKMLKAILAYHGIRIPKLHDIIELQKQCSEYINLTGFKIDDLIEINDYYESERYPGPKFDIPTMNEIKKNINVTENVTENRIQLIEEEIRNNSRISLIDLSRILNVSKMTIYRDIEKMKKNGIVKRVGPDKGGYWKIIDKNEK